MSIHGGPNLPQTLSLARQAIELARIRGVVLKYATAVNEGNLERMMECYLETDDISLVSIDSAYWGRKAVRSFLERVCGPEQLEKISKVPLDGRITLQGNMAMICSEHDLKIARTDGQASTAARMSLVLVHHPEQGWRLLHTHLSVPRGPYADPGERRH